MTTENSPENPADPEGDTGSEVDAKTEGQPPSDPGRRAFLAKVGICAGTVSAAAAVAPVLGAIGSPIGQKTVHFPDGFIDIGAMQGFEVGAPTAVLLKAPKTDAWSALGDAVIGQVLVVRKSATEATVFSSVCPHLGCAVTWKDEASQFMCPCHKSFFDRAGETVSGPSKRGLDPLETEVREGRLFVKYQTFALDVAERTPT